MHRFVRRSVGLVACVAAIASAPNRALAHTELDFSLPADGTTVGDPVEEITVGFTDQVALVGNGFEVHDPQGNLLTPFVVTDDNTVFKFQLDPPLAGGLVIVDFHIKSLDGDEQTGSFSFTAAAPLPTTAAPVPTTGAPVTSLATSSPTTAEATTAEATTTEATTTLPAVIAPAPTAAPSTAPASTDPTTTSPTADSEGGSGRTVLFAVLLAVAALAAGFLVIRSRRAG